MKKLDSSYNAEINQISKSEWEELLTRFDDATIYQTWSYGSVRWGPVYSGITGFPGTE